MNFGAKEKVELQTFVLGGHPMTPFTHISLCNLCSASSFLLFKTNQGVFYINLAWTWRYPNIPQLFSLPDVGCQCYPIKIWILDIGAQRRGYWYFEIWILGYWTPFSRAPIQLSWLAWMVRMVRIGRAVTSNVMPVVCPLQLGTRSPGELQILIWLCQLTLGLLKDTRMGP